MGYEAGVFDLDFNWWKKAAETIAQGFVCDRTHDYRVEDLFSGLIGPLFGVHDSHCVVDCVASPQDECTANAGV